MVVRALIARPTARRWVLAMPPVVALLYPALLAGAYRSAHSWSVGSGGPIAAATLAISLLLTFSIPVIAFTVAVRLGAIQDPTRGDVQARWFAHMAFSAPPFFTFVGVEADLVGYPSGDYVIWPIVWIALVVAAWIGASRTDAARASMLAPSWLRPIHGTVAALVILGFVALHVGNHLTGFWSPETHIAVMKVLRKWYRSEVVEPILVALMLFMVLSGALLLRARLTRPAGPFETLQTVTGAYLAMYIVAHMNSAFIYARMHGGIDTNFWWAAGSHAYLLGDPWSVRLLPHYAIAVWGVITHAGCGLRTVLLAHGVAQGTADRATVWISVFGALVALPVILGLVGVHIHWR